MSSISIIDEKIKFKIYLEDNLIENKNNNKFKLVDHHKEELKESITVINRSITSKNKNDINNKSETIVKKEKFITPVKIYNPEINYFQKLDEIQSKYSMVKNKNKPSILSKIGLDVINSNRVLTNFNKKNKIGKINLNSIKNIENNYHYVSNIQNYSSESAILEKINDGKFENKTQYFSELNDLKMISNNSKLNQLKNEKSHDLKEILSKISIEKNSSQNISENINNNQVLFSENIKFRRINIIKNNNNLNHNSANHDNINNRTKNSRKKLISDKEPNTLAIPEKEINSTAYLNSNLVVDILSNLDMSKENINISYKSIIMNSPNLNNTFDIENFGTLTEGKLLKDLIWEDVNLIKTLKLLEFWLDIENLIDNKNILILLKNIFIFIKEEISENELIDSNSFEFFQINNLNKIYSKFWKIFIIISSCFYIIYHNFPIDNTIKSQMRKLSSSFSNPLLNFFEFLIFNNKNCQHLILNGSNLKQDFVENYQKNLKSHKILKGTKTPEALISIIKNLDSCILMIKQFSK